MATNRSTTQTQRETRIFPRSGGTTTAPVANSGGANGNWKNNKNLKNNAVDLNAFKSIHKLLAQFFSSDYDGDYEDLFEQLMDALDSVELSMVPEEKKQALEDAAQQEKEDRADAEDRNSRGGKGRKDKKDGKGMKDRHGDGEVTNSRNAKHAHDR